MTGHLARGVALTAVGGALGALARWGVGEAWHVAADGFPWPVFAINVAGSALLAVLPALAFVRRHAALPVFLGTGVLGGFTTMSTASEQTASLVESGHAGTAFAYAAGTLAAALVAVALVDRFTTPAERVEFEEREGDE